MTYLLGIDVGTSSVKALLFDVAAAQIVAVQGQEYPIYTPTAERAEQDPADYWRATVAAVRAVCRNIPTPQIHAIGFSGQMHGTILLDRQQRPLQRAIIWADARSHQEAQELIAALPQIVAVTGTLPAAGFMAATLAWLARHEPALLAQTHQVILPKDYVRLQMTGEVSTDVSDAASTGLLAAEQGVWATELLAALGIAPDLMPPIHPSTAVVGTLRAAAAAELGLPVGIAVVTGCADQPAQAIGSGLITAGAASVTTGTGGQVFVPLQPHGTLPTDARLHVFAHAVPQTWYVLGAILAAGLALRWLRNLTGLADHPNAYAILSAEAATIPPGAGGVLFLPYLLGERTPHMDALASGAFMGLRYHHTRAHLARAVMEGVSFALRQTLELSLQLTGSVQRVIVAGGGAESAVWRQIQADIFNLPLQKTHLTEQACLGAALVAGVGSGLYADFAAACAAVVRYDEPTLPQHPADYAALYAEYLAAYPELKMRMHTLSKMAAQ